MFEAIHLIIVLIFVHLLLDYPLQGDFLSKAKNHKNPIPGVPWQTLLLSHAFLQAGAVYLVTESLVFFFLELVGHAIIDWAKSDDRISFNVDQLLHIGMKLFYVVVIVALGW